MGNEKGNLAYGFIITRKKLWTALQHVHCMYVLYDLLIQYNNMREQTFQTCFRALKVIVMKHSSIPPWKALRSTEQSNYKLQTLEKLARNAHFVFLKALKLFSTTKRVSHFSQCALLYSISEYNFVTSTKTKFPCSTSYSACESKM